MTSTRTIRLITAREIADRMRNKAYRYGTVFAVLLAVGLVVIPGLLSDDGPERFDLGVVGAVPEGFEQAVQTLPNSMNVRLEPVELADTEAAAGAITDGQVDAVLLDGSALMAQGAPDMLLRSAVEATLHHLDAAAAAQAAGLTTEQLSAIFAPPEPLTVVDTTGEQGADGALGWLVAFAATVLLFSAVMINAGSLLTGALEEKSSRVIEVLLGSVRPWQLLTSKIIAMTCLALAQLAVIVAAALGANALMGTIELPPATTATVLAALVMLPIGFVFYAALYTVAGSLASTVEDAQASAMPLGLVVMAAYLTVIFSVLPNPHGFWAQVLTYLPPTAPFTVPARVALDAISLWEAGLAAGLTLLAVALTVWLSARLYSASLLASGKLTWRQAWRTEPIQ